MKLKTFWNFLNGCGAVFERINIYILSMSSVGYTIEISSG